MKKLTELESDRRTSRRCPFKCHSVASCRGAVPRCSRCGCKGCVAGADLSLLGARSDHHFGAPLSIARSPARGSPIAEGAGFQVFPMVHK